MAHGRAPARVACDFSQFRAFTIESDAEIGAPRRYGSRSMSAVRYPSSNRTRQAAFLEVLDAQLSSAGPHARLGLLLVRLNSVDEMNLSLGYRTVDALLLESALRLARAFAPYGRCVRIGTKKFAIVLHDVAGASHALLAARKVERLLGRHPVEVRGQRIRVDVSQGIALYPEHAESAEELLKCADAALRGARETGRIVVHSPARIREIRELHRIEGELVLALERGGIDAHFQPQVDVATGEPLGAEALLRCRDRDGAPLPPERVVQAAQRSKLLSRLTLSMLNTALRYASEWPAGEFGLSFNVSPRSLADRDFVHSVRGAVDAWSWPSDRLTIEITENALMQEPETGFAIMRELRGAGMRVAIDDFGAGCSSLSYFKNVPANELKVDKSFVVNMRDSDPDRRIVRAVVDLAHAFGLKVVAEGVENPGGLRLLRKMRCDVAQGYLIGKPMPAAGFAEWLEGQRRRRVGA
jgi:diguanylate cyclase (GGDEF)-like protein